MNQKSYQCFVCEEVFGPTTFIASEFEVGSNNYIQHKNIRTCLSFLRERIDRLERHEEEARRILRGDDYY